MYTRTVTPTEINELISDNRSIIFIDCKVYDVTDFIAQHPAGQECITKKIGANCEADMKFHSKNARNILNRYFIGRLAK
jgi:cytochrome b involved in lipid metabolism